MNILFVCTGNTCRSPMAEAVAKHLTTKLELKEKGIELNFQSAGVMTSDGVPMSHNAINALRNEGIDSRGHSSQMINKELLDWADLVLTMTDNHKMIINSKFKGYKSKIYNLSSYLYNKDKDIADPYGGPIEMYAESLMEIKQMIVHLIDKIQSGLSKK